jgi:hypothetical protein
MNHAYASLDNLRTLEKMTVALQQWIDLDGKDFSMFPPDVRRPLADAYHVMRARIPALQAQRTVGRSRRRAEGD